MKFLKRLVKKIGKTIKRLFKSTAGGLLGGIGLSLLFPGIGNAMFGKMDWYKNFTSTMQSMNPFAKTGVTDGVVEIAPNLAGKAQATAARLAPSATTTAAEITQATGGGMTPFGGGAADALSVVGKEKIAEETKEGLITRIGQGIKDLPGQVFDEDFLPDVATGAFKTVATASLLDGDGEQEIFGMSPAPKAQEEMGITSSLRELPYFNPAQPVQSLTKANIVGNLSPQYFAHQTAINAPQVGMLPIPGTE
jgi:hypothetical protein